MYKTIKVTLKKVDESGKELDFDVQRYYIVCGDKAPSDDGPFKDPFVEVWADKSITLNADGTRLFLYADQWLGALEAVKSALCDISDDRKRSIEKWLVDSGDKTNHFGMNVDLSVNDTTKVFESSKFRTRKKKSWHADFNGLQIFYKDKWMDVARTDLKDDVCTTLCEVKSKKEWVDHYKRNIQYGARIKEKTFAVIDSISDG